jgi:hypothetical protein
MRPTRSEQEKRNAATMVQHALAAEDAIVKPIVHASIFPVAIGCIAHYVRSSIS